MHRQRSAARRQRAGQRQERYTGTRRGNGTADPRPGGREPRARERPRPTPAMPMRWLVRCRRAISRPFRSSQAKQTRRASPSSACDRRSALRRGGRAGPTRREATLRPWPRQLPCLTALRCALGRMTRYVQPYVLHPRDKHSRMHPFPKHTACTRDVVPPSSVSALLYRQTPNPAGGSPFPHTPTPRVGRATKSRPSSVLRGHTANLRPAPRHSLQRVQDLLKLVDLLDEVISVLPHRRDIGHRRDLAVDVKVDVGLRDALA